MDVQIKKAAPFELSESAISKISLLKESENNKFFRVYVTGGGCSGFQYGFKFDEFDQDEDAKLDFGDGVQVVLDHMSYPYIFGSKINIFIFIKVNRFKNCQYKNNYKYR